MDPTHPFSATALIYSIRDSPARNRQGPASPAKPRQSKAALGSNMTAQQTPRAAISPALKQRASETRSAFANQDAAASKQAHDETIRDWEEDGRRRGLSARRCVASGAVPGYIAGERVWKLIRAQKARRDRIITSHSSCSPRMDDADLVCKALL